MVFMGFVLGWQWTALRLVVGVILVFGMAYLANRFVGATELSGEVEESLVTQLKTDGNGSLWRRWLRELWQMSARLLPEYALIVIVLGAARAWLFPQVTADVGNHALWICDRFWFGSSRRGGGDADCRGSVDQGTARCARVINRLTHSGGLPAASSAEPCHVGIAPLIERTIPGRAVGETT